MEMISFLLLLVNGVSSLFLRVETGHQNIAISGRDPYYGHFTEINFQNLTCIKTIDIHCLKELTGAEEIDLLYSECDKGHWMVAHYTNSKNRFRLKHEINVQRLLVSSRDDLSIIDAQVQPCHGTRKITPDCHTSPRLHNHRHGKTGDTIYAFDPYMSTRTSRIKRSASFRPPSEVIQKGTYDMTEDKLVPSESHLTIQSGAILKFAKGKGLIVQGTIFINGTADEPVILDAIDEKWKGVHIVDGDKGSTLTNVKIYRSEIGLNSTGDHSPYLDHVLVDGNDVGVRMRSHLNTTSTKLNRVTSTNNKGNGIELLGKVLR